jgi:uncharacterized protein (TIGR03067 family)
MHACLFLSVSVVCGAPGLKEKATAPEVVGEWEIESQTLGGKPRARQSEFKHFRFTADGKWIILRGPADSDRDTRGYAINPKADPKTIDLIHPSKSVGQGIYKFDGKKLILHVAGTRNKRPEKFEPSDGVGQPVMISVLTPVKPKE